MVAQRSVRSKYRVVGGLIVLIGAWGALVPFIGPSFGFSMGNTPAWTWTESIATLHVLPGIVAVLAGVALIAGIARLGSAGLAAMAGAWFVIGPSLHPLWAGGATSGGQAMSGGMMMGMGGPHVSATRQALEAIGYHYGTGAAIAVLGAIGLGLALAAPASVAAEVERPPSREGVGLSRHPASA